jgi:hypothetical protein
MKLKSLSSTTTALMVDKDTAGKGSGADDAGEADYTTCRLVVENENADNGQRLVVKDRKTALWSSILC